MLSPDLNRARDLSGDAIREALEKTDLGRDEIIMPAWDGVQFGAKHQNVRVKPIILQVQDQKFVTVYPDNVQVKAPDLPISAWNKR